MKKKIYCVILCFLVLSIAIQLIPIVSSFYAKHVQTVEVENFEENKVRVTNSEYEKAMFYNEQIYKQGQTNISDIWTDPIYNGAPGMVIGHIEIPKLEVDIPLYWNASYDNLSKGAAVVAGTSYPIGGMNTNCVIAAHRGGIHGELLFRDIEKLEFGDKIFIHNLWDTLTYIVQKKIVIEPSDIDAVRILPGEDMVTLFSCHPYGLDTQRFVVYGVRDGEKTNDLPDGMKYESSEKRISFDKQIQKGSIYVTCMFAIVLLIKLFLSHRES